MRTKIQKDKSLTVLETRKDGTKFTSDALRQHAHAFFEANQQYEEAQKSLIDSVRRVARWLFCAGPAWHVSG